MIICKCGATFDPDESIGSEFGECQGCWEAACAVSWWEAGGCGDGTDIFDQEVQQ